MHNEGNGGNGMTLEDYLALFPGASREKERFMALAGAVLSQATDLQALVAGMQPAFSFASAEGAQLNRIAEAAGLARESGMTDEAFRQYLLSKLCLWGWDGSNEGTSAALAAQPGVSVCDNGNGTVTVTPGGTREDLVPVPAGVKPLMID